MRETTSNATTRVFVATSNRSTVSGHSKRLPGRLSASGTASSSSSDRRASTSRRSSDGTTIRYAVPSAPATIATRTSAIRTRMPPGSLTRI